MQRRESFPQNYLPIYGVAKMLGISERYAHELIHAKDDPIPHSRIGRKLIRVRVADLEAWVARRRQDDSELDRFVDEILKEKPGRGR